MAIHKEKIIIEVGGHDHFTSMRYHTRRDILDIIDHSWDQPDDTLFHNILVNPSMAPWQRNNPGISVMEVEDETLIPHKYHASYLNLGATIGKQHHTPYRKLEWRDLDYYEDFGID